ncbi:MAG TPA: hypothetical protein VN650_07955 [Gemmatimonadaceae bacterium]|nr:hypothetical protein [Gemmatimonadaceae bacterium]
MTAIPVQPAVSQVAPRAPLPPAPPYSLEPVVFVIPALAECAGTATLGGDREMALAALTTARLMLATIPPILLPEAERVTRAERARSWLSALTMPQPARMAILRSIDASVSGGMDAAASLRELMQVLTGHLSPAALTELGMLAERLRLYYEQTP